MSPKLVGPATLAIAAMAACALVAGLVAQAQRVRRQVSNEFDRSPGQLDAERPERTVNRVDRRTSRAPDEAPPCDGLYRRYGPEPSAREARRLHQQDQLVQRQYRGLLYASRGAKA